MVSYIRLMHPLTGLGAAAAAYAGAVVAGSSFVPTYMPLSPVLWALLSVFLIASSGMVVNDIADANIDKTNNPDMHATGKAGRKGAIAFAILLLIIGNFIPFYFISREALYITLVTTLIFLAYNAHAKKVPLLGNVLASILLALAIFFGAFVQGSYSAALPLIALAFLSSISREIYKTIDHALGEKHTPNQTIATKLGVIKARMLGSLFIVATVIASFAIFFTNLAGAVYLFFAVIADIIFVAAAVSPLRLSSKLIKAAMILIFIAFLADVYNARYLVTA